MLAQRYAAASAEITRVNADRKASIAAIEATADGLVVPLVAEVKDIAKQLQPWWETNMDELTGGKRKSIELGGCVIGYRVSPPKVTFAYGTDKDALAALNHFDRHRGLIRISESLNKTAILDELTDDDSVRDGIPLELIGFEAKQTEDFFLDLAGSDAAKVSAS